MRLVLSAVLGSALLAGCHARANFADADGNSQSVHIAMDGSGSGDNVSVTIPGFDAKVALPSMDLGRHVDLDGIRLAPDTKVGNIDVNARDADSGRGEDGGQWVLSFANPRAPAALVDYYRGQAEGAGYGGITAAASALTATKGDKRFALAVSPEGAGSKGTITMSGGS